MTLSFRALPSGKIHFAAKAASNSLSKKPLGSTKLISYHSEQSEESPVITTKSKIHEYINKKYKLMSKAEIHQPNLIVSSSTFVKQKCIENSYNNHCHSDRAKHERRGISP